MLSSATSTTWPVLKLGLTSSIPLLLERSSIRVLLDIGDSSLSCIRKCNKGARFDPARLSSLRRTFPSLRPGRGDPVARLGLPSHKDGRSLERALRRLMFLGRSGASPHLTPGSAAVLGGVLALLLGGRRAMAICVCRRRATATKAERRACGRKV
jgi:hypothetical protein